MGFGFDNIIQQYIASGTMIPETGQYNSIHNLFSPNICSKFTSDKDNQEFMKNLYAENFDRI